MVTVNSTRSLFWAQTQIDKFGNLNSTCIGNYWKPKVRFSGSGGACDAASLASGFIVFMQHEKNKFVEKLDYLTSPGWLQGGETRRNTGIVRGGPMAVVTNLGVMKFAEQTREMYLAENYPGVTIQRIVENTGFKIDVSKARSGSAESDEELRILRTEVDPQRLILG